MKTLDQRISDLLLDVYESASNPAHWQRVLQTIATEVKASKASMHVHSFAKQRHLAGSRLHSVGYDGPTAAAYSRYFAVRDPYVNGLRERLLGCGVGTSDELISTTDLRQTEFYADYGRPNGIFFVAWALVEQNERFASGLGLIRSEDAEQFSREQIAFLNLLTPHLAKSFRLQRVIEHATENNRALLSSAAQFDFGVISLDGDRRIINISAPAKALLDKQDGVRVHASRLKAAYTVEDLRLQEMLKAAACVWDHPHDVQRDTLLLTRQSGKKPLQVVVFPFSSSSTSGALLSEDRPRVLVLLSDPESKQPSRGEVLRSLYGLTPTESRLADLMLQGCEVREAAERMKTTIATTRFNLKRVLSKTGTHRQQKLMRLMLSLPGVSGRAGDR